MKRFLFPAGFNYMQERGRSWKPGSLGCSWSCWGVQNGRCFLIWNGSVEDKSFQEPTRDLGAPRSMSIKQCVMCAGSLLRACLKLWISERYHGKDVRKRWTRNTKQNQKCVLWYI